MGVIASYSRPQSLETSYAGAVASLAAFTPICIPDCTLQKKDWFATSTKFEFPAAADAGVDCFDMIHIIMFCGFKGIPSCYTFMAWLVLISIENVFARVLCRCRFKSQEGYFSPLTVRTI